MFTVSGFAVTDSPFLCGCCPGIDALRIHRQNDSELAALAGRALDGNISSMSMNNMTNQRESQTAPFGCVNQRIADSVEFLKNLVLLRFWNANSVVNHFQFDGTVFAIEIHIQEFIFLRVL